MSRHVPVCAVCCFAALSSVPRSRPFGSGCTIVKNRQAALSALLATKADSGAPLPSAPARCWVPARVHGSNWPYYVDNTVFGEKYNAVVPASTAQAFDEYVSETKAVADGGPLLCVVAFHVVWSSACRKAMISVEELAPSQCGMQYSSAST